MLKYEWKKLLINRRGLWLILGVLLAELLGMLLFTKPYDRVLEENRAVYEDYLTPVIGSLTQEKRDSIETEMERLNQIHREMEKLKNDYYSGAVIEEEYRQQFEMLVADDQLYTGFSKLYSQYIFVRAQENRAFLYTGGWEVLLTNQEPDYLLLLLLVIVLSPVFCEEYASRMHEVHLTQKKSARSHVGTKLAVALLLTAVLVAILQLADLVYCTVRFGLPNGDFSLQSLQSFGTTAKKLTLWQSFWLQFGLKELGYLYAATWILFLSVAFEKYATTLMAGIASLVLPFLTVGGNEVFLPIPAPWALTLGSIYLNPDVTARDPQTGEAVVLTEELSFGQIGMLVMAVVILLGLMLLFIRQKNTNWQLKSRKWKLSLLACLGALLLSGCGAAETAVIYNAEYSSWCETEDYVLLNDQLNTYFIDKEKGVWYPLPLEAAARETASVESDYFAVDGNIYYVRCYTLRPIAGSEAVQTTFDLMRLDENTLTVSVCFQWNVENSWFFGLLEKEHPEPSPYMINTFFIHENGLYYQESENGGWSRMDLKTGEAEVFLDAPNALNVAYDGECVYYTDEYNRLVIQRMDTGEKTVLETIATEKFLLTPQGIYFLNRRDNNTLYYYDAQKDLPVKLDDTPAYALYYDQEYLWVMSRNDYMLYRINHDGTGRIMVESPGVLRCVGERLYFTDLLTDAVYEMDKTTLEWNLLEACG